MNHLLKIKWDQLTNRTQTNKATTDRWWNKIIEHYSQKKRAYHNLSHLENMFRELDKYSEKVEDIDGISFSIFFHDK